MPLAVDTQATFDFVFKSDKDKPEADRPALVFRYLSARNYTRVLDLFEASAKAATDEEMVAKIIEGARIALAGWKNLGEFDANRLDEVLTMLEVVELRDSLLSSMVASEADKKKCVSQPQSTSGSSVEPTPPASA